MSQPFTVVIPARYASTRLPGKPLIDIAGKPMIQRVYECAQKSDAERVVVATDDTRIIESVEGFGGEVVMTRADHPSGTDRLAETARLLGLDDEHIVVNVQGDEPLLPSKVINSVAINLAQREEAGIATLCERIHQRELVFDPNCVKVVADVNGMAMYFSRAPIPWARDFFAADSTGLPESADFYRHIGIYAYKARFLYDYTTWGVSPMENLEALEQLRALWYGEKIHVGVVSEAPPAGVDTEQDLERVRRLLEQSGD